MHAMKFLVHRTPPWLFLSRPFQLFMYYVYYRYWCPGSDCPARECVMSGHCGCDNAPRYRDPRLEEMRRISDDFGAGPILRYGEDRYGGVIEITDHDRNSS